MTSTSFNAIWWFSSSLDWGGEEDDDEAGLGEIDKGGDVLDDAIDIRREMKNKIP